MKIGMIVENEFPPDNRVEREAEALISDGHEVHLLCFSTRKDFSNTVYHRIIIRRFYFSPTFFKKLSPLALTVPFYFWKWSKPLNCFLDQKFDVVHLHNIPLIKPLVKVKSKLGFKLIIDLHEDRPAIMKLYSHITNFPGNVLVSIKRWELYQKKYLRGADGIIVVTKEAKELLLKETIIEEAKIIHVNNYIDVDKYDSILINNEIVNQFKNSWNVVYVGVTGFRRGIDIAIRAIGLASIKIPNIKFIIVGAGRDDEKLKILTKKLGLEKFINFVGWVQDFHLKSYVQAAQVCISPLRRNRHHDTTIANKITQYLASKKPVIASDCLAQKKIIEKYNCGFVYPAEDINLLANCIIRLHGSSTLTERFSKNAGIAIKELNWANEAEKIKTFYHRYVK